MEGDRGVNGMSVYNPSGSGEVHIDSVLSRVVVDVPYEIRMDNGRHCVYKIGTNDSMGCHDTRGDAEKQLAALYAVEGGKMGENASYLVDLNVISLDEGGKTWIHALPYGNYSHPKYGTIQITPDRVARFADNVKKKVRIIDPSINYDHTEGSEAAAWVKDAETRADGLWLCVEFVAEAMTKVKEKKYRYFSVEFANEWETNQGQKYQDVIIGGALTNRPFMKNLVPINLSEATIDNAIELASAISGKSVEELKGKGTQMNDAELQKIIDGVTAKLSEKIVPPAPKDEPKNQIQQMAEIEELKKLAEGNPLIANLFKHFESQAVQLTESAKLMRETMVDAKLAEFDNSKLTLTPVAKQLARELMLGMSDDQINKFSEFIGNVRTSASFLVELGERAGAAVRHGYSMSDKTATQIFNEKMNELMAGGLDYIAAANQVAAADPELYNRYRMGEGAEYKMTAPAASK